MVKKAVQRRRDIQRYIESERERENETAGPCRQGEISVKTLQLRLQTAFSAPRDPWLKQQQSRDSKQRYRDKRECCRSTAEKNNHSVSVVPRTSTHCEIQISGSTLKQQNKDSLGRKKPKQTVGSEKVELSVNHFSS